MPRRVHGAETAHCSGVGLQYVQEYMIPPLVEPSLMTPFLSISYVPGSGYHNLVYLSAV